MSNPRGRRFNNNRFVNNRGGGYSRGQPMNNSGFQFNGQQGNPQGRSNFRPQVAKPRVCLNFQQGVCSNPACHDLHQYSYHNEVGRVQQISTPTAIFAACLIAEAQIATALVGKIAIFDIKSGRQLAEFPVQGRTKSLTYSDDFGQAVLLFCGDTQNRQLLGGISLTGSVFAFKPAHASGVNCLIVRKGLIFAGGDDGKVSVWYCGDQGFELGMLMEMDAQMLSQVLCLELVQSFVIAGLGNGLVVGWEYNFDSNQYMWRGNLHLMHKGKVTGLEVLNDSFIFSAGEDGIVNCWDAASGFTGGPLLNATKTKPVQITQIRICDAPNGNALLLGTSQGKILWYTLQQSEARFMQPFSFHKRAVTSLLRFYNLENFSGFISTSVDSLAIVSNWNQTT